MTGIKFGGVELERIETITYGPPKGEALGVSVLERMATQLEDYAHHGKHPEPVEVLVGVDRREAARVALELRALLERIERSRT